MMTLFGTMFSIYLTKAEEIRQGTFRRAGRRCGRHHRYSYELVHIRLNGKSDSVLYT